MSCTIRSATGTRVLAPRGVPFAWRHACAGAALLLVIAAAGAWSQQHGRDTTAARDTSAAGTARMGAMDMSRDTMPAMAAMRAAPLGIPDSRAGSGTSWVPDASPTRDIMWMAGTWDLMFNYDAYLYYDRQNDARAARRGDDQVGSTNWAMIMAMHALGTGRLQLRSMLSAEPWTVGSRGYPLLLQSGESYHGVPLHDRQHPHDLFMELAALYETPISPNLALQLYAAPAGEPVVGPVAYPHRPSAADDPFAPIGHHWQDATHVSFGVATAGLYSRTWKLEASIFNGREPDEDRTNLDLRRLDSYAGRLTVNPSRDWSLSASYAYLASPDALSPNESERRMGASILETQAFGRAGTWSSALIYGANTHAGERRVSNSALAESDLNLDGTNAVFVRIEYVNKTAADLDVAGMPPDRRFDLGSAVLGYVRTIARARHASVGIGGRASLDFVPDALRAYYGSARPVGVAIFLRVRSSRAGRP